MPRSSLAQLYPEEVAAGYTCDFLGTQFELYVKEAQRLRELYRDRITILVGVESEWFGDGRDFDLITKLKADYKLDFMVGSVHHLHQIPIDYSAALVTQINNGVEYQVHQKCSLEE